jgi:hypothetical protein
MAIGDIYVLDKNLDIVYVIDTYKSCIWSNRYVELGDCEVYLPATSDLLSVLVKDYYLMRLNDDMVCRINKIQLDTDAENGDYLIVTGKDTKALCDQRIICDTMTCNGTLEAFIRQMVTSSMINASATARNMLKPNGSPLLALGTAAGFTEVSSEQVTYKNLGEKIREYCTKYGWGYKMIPNKSTLNLILYKGVDRSNNVIFSDDYENLDATTYIQDDTNMGNVALVGGEGEGSARSKDVSGYAESSDRYEIFVDAKDITHTVTWSDLSALYPTTASGGQGYFATESGQPVYRLNYLDIQIVDEEQLSRLRSKYPSGTVVTIDGIDYYQVSNVTIADVPSSSPSGSDNVTLRDVIYDVYLLNRGYEKLADYGEKISFNGTIEPNVTFMYKEDYNLGDIVTVENQYGVSASVRIVEVIEVDDDNGYSVQPKFQIIEREG